MGHSGFFFFFFRTGHFSVSKTSLMALVLLNVFQQHSKCAVNGVWLQIEEGKKQHIQRSLWFLWSINMLIGPFVGSFKSDSPHFHDVQSDSFASRLFEQLWLSNLLSLPHSLDMNILFDVHLNCCACWSAKILGWISSSTFYHPVHLNSILCFWPLREVCMD